MDSERTAPELKPVTCRHTVLNNELTTMKPQHIRFLILIALGCVPLPTRASCQSTGANPNFQGPEAYIEKYDWPWTHEKWNNKKDPELEALRIRAYKMLEEFDPHEAEYRKAKAESQADPKNRVKLAKWGWYSAAYHNRTSMAADDRELMLAFGNTTGDVTFEFARMRMIAAAFNGYFGKSLHDLARRIAAEDQRDYEIRRWLGMLSATHTPALRERTEKYADEMLKIDPNRPTAYVIYASIEARAALGTEVSHQYKIDCINKCKYWANEYLQREHRPGTTAQVNAVRDQIRTMDKFEGEERAALAAEKSAAKKK